jgi:hypothetical protein
MFVKGFWELSSETVDICHHKAKRRRESEWEREIRKQCEIYLNNKNKSFLIFFEDVGKEAKNKTPSCLLSACLNFLRKHHKKVNQIKKKKKPQRFDFFITFLFFSAFIPRNITIFIWIFIVNFFYVFLWFFYFVLLPFCAFFEKKNALLFSLCRPSVRPSVRRSL